MFRPTFGGFLASNLQNFQKRGKADLPEEVGQLSRDFFGQSNRVIFEAFLLSFLGTKFTSDGKTLEKRYKHSCFA